MRRTFEPQGLGYVMTVPELATELAVDHLYRSRGELKGQITVSCGLDGIKARGGNVHTGNVNLSGSTSRASLARYLTTRAQSDLLDWGDLVEDFFRQVLTAERDGDPVERVGALPMPLEIPTRIHPIVPRGDTTIIYGDQSTGKSTLAAALAVSVQTGAAIVPGWTPRKAPVLYLDWEAGRDSINKRVRGVAMGAHIPGITEIDYINCRRRGTLLTFAEDLARDIDRAGYGLVVVDSVGMAAGVGDGGDANETTLRLFAAFGYLRTTILAIDHIPKAEAEGGRRTRAYGSVYKGALARATYQLQRAKAPDGRWLIKLVNTKFNDGDELADQAFKVHHDTDGAIAYERLDGIPAELMTGEPTIWEMAKELLETGDYTLDQLADAIERPKPSVRATLYRFAKDGLCEHLPSGRWRLIRRTEASA